LKNDGVFKEYDSELTAQFKKDRRGLPHIFTSLLEARDEARKERDTAQNSLKA